MASAAKREAKSVRMAAILREGLAQEGVAAVVQASETSSVLRVMLGGSTTAQERFRAGRVCEGFSDAYGVYVLLMP